MLHARGGIRCLGANVVLQGLVFINQEYEASLSA